MQYLALSQNAREAHRVAQRVVLLARVEYIHESFIDTEIDRAVLRTCDIFFLL